MNATIPERLFSTKMRREGSAVKPENIIVLQTCAFFCWFLHSSYFLQLNMHSVEECTLSLIKFYVFGNKEYLDYVLIECMNFTDCAV